MDRPLLISSLLTHAESQHGQARARHAQELPHACAPLAKVKLAAAVGTFGTRVDRLLVGLGMIPIENSIAGRVADIHHFLPASGLHIIGEYFFPIHLVP